MERFIVQKNSHSYVRFQYYVSETQPLNLPPVFFITRTVKIPGQTKP